MKLLEQTPEHWRYELEDREAQLLLALLGGFPFTKLRPSQITRGPQDAASLERQNLLNEYLVAHREELKQAAGGLMNESVELLDEGWRLTLTVESKETLLQILNDIRIGAWRDLGEPEDTHKLPQDSAERHQLWSVMTLAGMFEEALAGLGL